MYDMNIFILLKFIFLGLLQGFTEPLPISSSGHLVIMRDLLNIHTSGLSFEIIVHFGSLIAIILVYFKDIKLLLKNSLLFVLKRDQTYYYSFKFLMLLLITTLITGVIGLSIEQFVSETLAKSLFIGIAFLITSFFIWKIRHFQGHKSEVDITIKDAIIVGLAQSVALIPGISRSGATIIAAMFLGMKRITALRFSFLLFIPVSIGINILSLKSIINDPEINLYAIPYTVAFLAALIATFYALKWFIHVMEKGRLHIFSYYCFTLGTIVILFQLKHFFI